MVTPLTLFPTPYPDETFYSVVCRYDFRKSRYSFRGTCEELFGRRIGLNTDIPQCIGSLVKRLPRGSGLTAKYFINNTTSFPYFNPFLTVSRKNTFTEYMGSGESKYFALGTSKLRQPKNIYLRFCKSCWKENTVQYGEPYWHRAHQLPGVFMCCRHGEFLVDSPVYSAAANNDFFIASADLMEKGTSCGSFDDTISEKFMALSADSEWLLLNGGRIGSYDDTLQKYDLWLRKNQFRSYSGRTWPKELYDALCTYYGEPFLKLINAFDEGPLTWTERIIFYVGKLQHPMYHILLMRFLAGSVSNFFEEKCEETLPYGQSPWPCRNPVCPYNLKDVIEKIEIRYNMSYCRALFKCPHCGFSYRRKNPIPKEQQYDGMVYIAEYGPLWESILIDYLANQHLTPRQTCELMQCDFYTVNKYAVQLGLWEDGAVTSYEKGKKKPPYVKSKKPVLSFDKERAKYRKRWRQLMKDRPNAIRSELLLADPISYTWLRKNDLKWYESQSPPAKYVSTDWNRKDIECLPIVKVVIETLRNTENRPPRITKKAVIGSTGMYLLGHSKASERLPLTTAYLAENVESVEQWYKRKIRWAVKKIYEMDGLLTLNRIMIKAAMKSDKFEPMKYYASECIDELQNPAE